MMKGLRLLEENLMKIYRGLNFLKERENIGFVNQNNENSNEDLFYPNRLIRLLHKICDF